MSPRIKELRQAAHLSQQKLAEMTGLSIRTIAYAEDGRDARLSTLRVIANALGVGLDDLFEKASA